MTAMDTQGMLWVIHCVPIISSQVPELWARWAYPSLKPLAAWVKDYHQVGQRFPRSREDGRESGWVDG
jgi:hypothetical protein